MLLVFRRILGRNHDRNPKPKPPNPLIQKPHMGRRAVRLAARDRGPRRVHPRRERCVVAGLWVWVWGAFRCLFQRKTLQI
jgi:hypothetical protein